MRAFLGSRPRQACINSNLKTTPVSVICVAAYRPRQILSPDVTSYINPQPVRHSARSLRLRPRAVPLDQDVTFYGGLDACRLIHLTDRSPGNKLMVFLPGTDGTGLSILAQVPSLKSAGWDVWTLYLPVKERSGWNELTTRTVHLLRELSMSWREQGWEEAGPQQHTDLDPASSSGSGSAPLVTLVGESFGGCLALRVALREAAMVQQLILINPATCFKNSLGGLSSLFSGTNLLGFFPEQLYAVAQATMQPLVADAQRIAPANRELLRRMVLMEPASRLLAAGSQAGRTEEQPLPGPFQGSGQAAAWPAQGQGQATPWPAQGQRQAAPGPAALLSGFAGRLPSMLSYGPAGAASFRVGMLRDGGLPEAQLRWLKVPTLILSSARDRVLPSIEEGARLTRLIPKSMRIILPNSGHSPLFEADVDFPALIRQGHAREVALSPKQAHAPPSGHASGAGTPGDGSEASASDARQARPQGPTASPSVSPWAEWAQRLAPLRDLVSPVVMGTENLPLEGSKDWARPMLFVGNHGKMGLYDAPMLMYELYLRGYNVRGLAHPGHWNSPLGAFFEAFGAVKASPMAAFRLLKNNEKVLLFPGGAREVVKRRGEEYQLMWKDKPDFVRLATKCQAIIMPFAAVGADDAYDVIMETDEQLQNPILGPLFRGLLGQMDKGLNPAESIFPLTRLPVLGLPTPFPVPNLTRLYFKFGTPYDTATIKLDLDDAEKCQQLYDSIRSTINQDLSELQTFREGDGNRDLGVRVQRSVAALMGSATARQAQPGQEDVWEDSDSIEK